MKEIQNNETENGRKKYTALLGLGIGTLVLAAVWYGIVQNRANDSVEQEIQYGYDNPVSGPVAETENISETTESEQEEPEQENAVKKQNKITSGSVKTEKQNAGYNGSDKLQWPVSGNVIIPYSMDTTVYFETLDQYQCSPALHIKTEEGTPVKAIYEGTVTGVHENDRYGHMVTVDLGNGFSVFYGQLEEISLKKGDKIKTGEVIGTVASPTDYFVLEGSHLYLKMTKDGQPVNPAEYLEP